MNAMTHMRREILEIPDAVARLLIDGDAALREAGAAIRARNPHFVVTVARGSSDHAASFLKYAIELTAGLAVASVGPSIASIYGAKLRLNGAACLAISQSGKSPDIVAMAEQARAGGALTIALTNTADSPLAQRQRPRHRHSGRRRKKRRGHQELRQFGRRGPRPDGAHAWTTRSCTPR